jgi:hypothetical protein
MFMWSLLLYRPCLCCHCYCTVHVYVVIAIVSSMFMLSLLLYRPCLCGHCYCTVHVYVVIPIVPSMFMLSFIIVIVCGHFEWKQLCAARSSPYVPIGSYKSLPRWSYSSQHSEYICYSVELESAGF